jgi:hypothetical protein
MGIGLGCLVFFLGFAQGQPEEGDKRVYGEVSKGAQISRYAAVKKECLFITDFEESVGCLTNMKGEEQRKTWELEGVASRFKTRGSPSGLWEGRVGFGGRLDSITHIGVQQSTNIESPYDYASYLVSGTGNG